MLDKEETFNKKIISYVRKNSRNSILAKREDDHKSKDSHHSGTGLGQLASEITDSYSFSYQDIPNFPVSTVEGHAGSLIFGRLGGKDIMAMKGRFHFYEGYNMKDVTFPFV